MIPIIGTTPGAVYTALAPNRFKIQLPAQRRATLPDYLERLREALFLTGAALQSVKVINGDCATEWFAPHDLVQRLNGARAWR
jgi:hypothetical protein